MYAHNKSWVHSHSDAKVQREMCLLISILEKLNHEVSEKAQHDSPGRCNKPLSDHRGVGEWKKAQMMDFISWIIHDIYYYIVHSSLGFIRVLVALYPGHCHDGAGASPLDEKPHTHTRTSMRIHINGKKLENPEGTCADLSNLSSGLNRLRWNCKMATLHSALLHRWPVNSFSFSWIVSWPSHVHNLL